MELLTDVRQVLSNHLFEFKKDIIRLIDEANLLELLDWSNTWKKEGIKPEIPCIEITGIADEIKQPTELKKQRQITNILLLCNHLRNAVDAIEGGDVSLSMTYLLIGTHSLGFTEGKDSQTEHTKAIQGRIQHQKTASTRRIVMEYFIKNGFNEKSNSNEA